MLIRNRARVRSSVFFSQECVEPALHLAIQGGHGSVVNLLLRRRSLDANSKDEGLSPLMRAASCSHAKIVRLLLDKV